MYPGILNVAVMFPRLLGATIAGRCCMEAAARRARYTPTERVSGMSFVMKMSFCSALEIDLTSARIHGESEGETIPSAGVTVSSVRGTPTHA